MAKNSLPNWVILLSTGIAALGLFVGGSLYIAPEKFIPNLNLSLANTTFLTQMWAARQIAIAAMIGLSTFKRSALMLKVALGTYFLMTFQDILIGVYQKDSGLIMGTAFFCALSVLMLLRLRKA